MHEKIYEQFDRICRERRAGGAVLETGAVPSDASLLALPSLKNAVSKTGVNLDPPSRYKDFAILQVNSNLMNCFGSNQFDTVLCNATLEHDKHFWKTLAEIQRVAKPGALVVLGAPGYTRPGLEKWAKKIARKLPFAGTAFRGRLDDLCASTLTLHVHNYPGDYYRFSPQTFREVFFEGMREVEIFPLLTPPRIIGSGIKG